MIFLKLTIPNDLAGASLLGVHNWIKSNIARTNPGGSPDYTISDMSGNQLTLSDVARNPGAEILVNYIEGVRPNPSSLAPVPGLEFTFPSLPRTGNDITAILPDEIDSALAQRIISEQGLNRGLHTLNRLLLKKSAPFPVSPTTAAVLQMGQNLLVKSNPADRTPFTQRTPNFYSPEKALESYLKSITGAEKITPSAQNAIFDAGIAAKYGLNRENISQFATDVAAEFLWAASANRGFIRMVIARLPDLRGDRTTIAKLLEMFPQRADQFYNGTQNVFVASPIFIYPNLGSGLLTDKQLRTVISAAENYPQNVSKSRFPRGLDKLVVSRRSTAMWFSELIGLNFLRGTSIGSKDQADLVDRAIEEHGFGEINRRLVQSVASPGAVRQLQRLSSKAPIGFLSDIGGFYPSPPPKWPSKLVYAVMDAMLENLPRIINIERPLQSRLYPIALQTTANLPNEITVPQPYAELLPPNAQPSVTMRLKDENGQLREFTNATMQEFRDFGFFIPTPTQIENAGTVLDRRDSDRRQTIISAVMSAINDQIQGKGTGGELRFDPTVQGISMLELVYLAAEIATDKYDYNARGDDYLFIAALLHYSVAELATVPRAQPLIPQQITPGFLRRMFAGASKTAVSASAALLATFVTSFNGTMKTLGSIRNKIGKGASYDQELKDIKSQLEELKVLIEGLKEAGLAEAGKEAVGVDYDALLPPLMDDLNLDADADATRAAIEAILTDEWFEEHGIDPNADPFVNPPRRNPTLSYNDIQNMVTAAKQERGSRNIEVVKALAGSMSETAERFVSQPTYTDDATQNKLIKDFYGTLKTMVETNRIVIKDIANTIERDLPDVFKIVSGKVTINAEPMMEIRKSIGKANELIEEAELEFAEVMSEMQRVGSSLKASMGAHPKFQQALERAAYIDLNDTLLFNKLDTSEDLIYTALTQIEFDAVPIEGFKQVYHALFKLVEELMEVYAGSDAFLNQGNGEDNKDPQSVKGLQLAFNSVRNNYLNDVEHLRLKDSLNIVTSNIKLLTPNLRIEDLSGAVQEALTSLD